ncbi:MAG: hypothetical protein HN849_21625 [Victivallales bacterium]|nr:hypothetical protein [Victivallales bacterium]
MTHHLTSRMHLRISAVLALLALPLALVAQDYQQVLPATLTPRARESRQAWLQAVQGENLAAGKAVTFASTPSYRLTKDDNDPHDLTDGKLTPRNDDRMWFDKAAVGWATHPASFMVDLGTVQPIRSVVLRFLGGAEQDGLRFPRRIELMVSEDGETFYHAAALHKLNLGEKERAGEPGVFFLPETGKAYAYPLALEGLRTKARYVGITLHGDKGFLFADEMVVLKGDFAADTIALPPKDKTTFIIRGTAFGPKEDVFPISADIAAPYRFWITDARPAEAKKKPLTYVMELPWNIMIHENSSGTITETQLGEGPERRRRIAVTGLKARAGQSVGPFFFTVGDVKRLAGTEATFYATCDGYEAHRTTVPVQVIAIPRVPPLRRLHVSLSWMSTGNAIQWPGFLDAWEHLGFNAVATFPRYWKNTVTPEREELLAAARKRGMKIIYNESPFHMMEHRWKKRAPEIYSQIEGKTSKNLCPSYRGEAYADEMKRVGDCYGLVKADYVFYDIECWYRGSTDAMAGRCTRCKAAHGASGKEMGDWLSDRGTEMIRDMNTEIRERVAELGLKQPHIATYNNQAAKTLYHFVFDFNKLHPELLESSQPSLYVKGMAELVHDSIRSNYQVMKSRDIIPWLSTGTYGEHAPAKVEPMILESFLNGAMGITYYCYSDFDTPLDFYYHAKALATLAPYEDLLADGAPVPVTTDNDLMAVSAYRNGQEMLILVGNYARTPTTKIQITLPLNNPGKVLDLRTNADMKPTAQLVLNVMPGDFALVYVKGTE